MSFVEVRFLLFVATVILLYYVLPKKAQWVVLLCASVVFYGTYGWEKLPFILISSLLAWFSAMYMERTHVKTHDSAEAKQKNKPVLVFTVILLAGLLLYAKVGTWVAESVAAAFKLQPSGASQAIVALGVSYYTFSLISYVVDVYWRKEVAETNYFRLLLFAIYFPKVLQGPISRHTHVASQLREHHQFDYKQLCYGLQRMIWGYFKKLVIADRLAILVRTVFAVPEQYSGSVHMVAMIFATLQLYCDFSGCMDIVSGISQTLGLQLEENFRHPFFSKTVVELWRRWHATLGSWFRDYIYIPLGGSRCGKWMRIRNVMVVWIVTGLWHGPDLPYTVWGIYWGILVSCSGLFGSLLKKLSTMLKIDTDKPSWKVVQMFRTFALFVCGWIPVFPGTLEKSLLITKKMLFDFNVANLIDGTLFTLGLDRWNFIVSIVCVLVLWVIGFEQERGSVRDRIADCNIVVRWSIYYFSIIIILLFGIYGPGYDATTFIYMQF